MIWRKSSYSAANGQCVEIAEGEQVMVRDSKNPGPVLAFSHGAFAVFVEGVKSGAFARPKR